MSTILRLILLLLLGLALSGCSTVSLDVGQFQGSGNVPGVGSIWQRAP
ncbi:MAG: hypothetical protein HGA19_24765 [Oscillochloris sp.]|nr:hypothetical protein [Oscillochloris sp.]